MSRVDEGRCFKLNSDPSCSSVAVVVPWFHVAVNEQLFCAVKYVALYFYYYAKTENNILDFSVFILHTG